MKRKTYIIGILAVVLAFAAASRAPKYEAIVSSAQSFQQHFHAMRGTAGSLGPIERFVYSLILAHTNVPENEKHIAHPGPRT
jgi:hypothetical protein